MSLTSLRKTLSVSLPQSSWPWLPLQEEAEELFLLELLELKGEGELWPGLGELPSPESGLCALPESLEEPAPQQGREAGPLRRDPKAPC